MTTGPILVFDSGVGARAVDMALKARMPRATTVVVTDHDGFPYGSKQPAWIEARVVDQLTAAMAQHAPSAIVLACNTASLCAGGAVQSALKDIPLYLTLPPLGDAVRYTATRQIGVLVTPVSAAHPLFKRRIAQLRDGGVQATIIADERLAIMAETYIANKTLPDLNALRDILSPVSAAPRMDVCVLGCTHYGFLRNLIEKTIGREMVFVDSAESVAQRIATDLKTANQIAR